ncbi:MAG: NapC/NirT family cytochrome c [Anaerosomatales bacterium]|nr:NapC/NirT family cytochrome c [Anaerosomatales bacterium]MDT8434825.1 NapC/NirT family cytochrome c [Anaerosomatales bacterium]
MPKLKTFFSGYADPMRRPRYLIWTGAVVLGLAAFVVVALGVTSTYWFCANVCHKVQDDTIIAYDRSPHSEVSCMACHMPVNADPVTFLLHKAEALGELYLTATNKFELPLNHGSHLALSQKYMGPEQCNQCHWLENRTVTPSPGIVIDHAVHDEAEIHCTVCHNRTAHVEDFELTLTDPGTGEPNQPHEDFMLMAACYRCHTTSGESVSGIVAPAECEACHTPDFELMPANHSEPGFYEPYGESGGHAAMANEDFAAYTAARADLEEPHTDAPMYEQLQHLPPVAAVGYCQTCHNERVFCDGCHGVQMPHPEGFAKEHGEDGRTRPEVCENCHASAPGSDFCNDCHHEGADPNRAWIPQHMEPVREGGAQQCFDCHNPTYCAECHVRGSVSQ